MLAINRFSKAQSPVRLLGSGAPAALAIGFAMALGLGLLRPSAALAESDEALAKEGCACVEKPYAKTQELIALVTKAQANGDTAQLMSMQGEMMGIVSAAQRCFDDLAKKYPKVAADEARLERINAEMEKICPAPQMPGMPPAPKP